MRAVALALVLAACAPKACPPAFVVSPAPRQAYTPPPKPSACVEQWYAKADTPECVDAWIDDLAAHRLKARRGG